VGRGADTFVEDVAQMETPVPSAAVDEVTFASAVAPFTPADRPEAPDAIPPELAHHERVGDRSRRRFMIATAMLAFVVAGLLGVAVYRIATDKGELVIRTESDDVKVVITQGGKQVDVIDAKTDKQISLALRSGVYESQLKGAPEGLKLDIDRATLTRGETVLATITKITPKQAQYLMLPIDKVASAVSTKGLFSGSEALPTGVERLIFPNWGKQEVFGIPFNVIDPKGDSVKNAIVLYGPMSPLVREMPQAVKLKCGSPAKAIHLLSGVAGWGYRDDGEHKKTVCVIVRLHYRDGVTEDYELINGVHFCDYNCDANRRLWEVPGSRLAIRLLESDNSANQIRYLAIQPKNPTKVLQEIEFIKGMKGDITAPVIMAVTVERPGPSEPNGGEAPMPEQPPAKKPPDGVIAWWRADGDAKDSVGDNHGTLKAGVTFAPGVAGKAFRLDGATRYVEVPHSDLWGFGRRDFSIELWVQFRALTPSRDIGHPSAVFIGCDEGGNKWFFAYGGGFLNFHVTNANGKGGFYAKADFSADVDKWYHLAATRNRGTFTIYVDGGPVASEKVDIIIPNPDAPLTIGQAEAFFFSGLIDEVAIYDRALSPAEVKARWSALAPGTKQAPAAEKVGEVRHFGTPDYTMLHLVLSPDGQRLLTAGTDGTARYWNIETGKEIYRLPSKGGQVYGAAISPDGTKLLSCGGDRLIHVWDAATGQEVKQLKGHTDEVLGVAISPDGRMVASSGYDCQLRLWNLDTGELIASPGNVQGLGAAFSPDGKLIATWAKDHMVRLWDVKDRIEVRCLKGHKEWVRAGAFSADGSHLLTGTWPSDGNGPVARPSDLKLWEVGTGKLLRTIDLLPRANAHGVAISPDGWQALSCGTAGLVELWDLETGKQMIAFRGHVGAVNDVAFLPDGRTALSVGSDGTIRLWGLPDLPPADKKPSPSPEKSREKVGEVRQFLGHTDMVTAVAGRATIKGKVTFAGDPLPPAKTVTIPDNNKDKDYCHKGPLNDPSWMVDPKTKGVKNVVIWVKPPQGKYFPVPADERKPAEKTVKIDQPFCAFEPHVAIVFPSYFDGKKQEKTGQELVVVNSAFITHNTNWVPIDTSINSGDNVMLPPKQMRRIELFTLKPNRSNLEDRLTLKCNIHPWMTGYVWAFDHPYAAVTKEDGSYEIKNVPAGSELYIIGWHEVANYIGPAGKGTNKGEAIGPLKDKEIKAINFQISK
jgi:WD40 repeat protein